MGDIEVQVVENLQAGARAFFIDAAPKVSLVVWDRASDMHSPGEVWGVFVDGRPPRAGEDVAVQVDALVFAARAHFSRALHLVPAQRGLSSVESRCLAGAGLVAAA